jgi:Ca2+-dependent lipid-binding protein
MSLAFNTVEISLIRACNLPAGDGNGLSDPYVVVYLGGQDVARTGTIAATLNLVWNESCLVSLDAFKLNQLIACVSRTLLCFT